MKKKNKKRHKKTARGQMAYSWQLLLMSYSQFPLPIRESVYPPFETINRVFYSKSNKAREEKLANHCFKLWGTSQRRIQKEFTRAVGRCPDTQFFKGYKC